MPERSCGDRPRQYQRSDPQTQASVTRTTALVGSWTIGSGTSSTRISPGPWKIAARMSGSLLSADDDCSARTGTSRWRRGAIQRRNRRASSPRRRAGRWWLTPVRCAAQSTARPCARRFADRVSPLSLRGGGYLNYPELDQTAARVAAAYPPDSWARLQRLKRRLDPANRFRFNANIPPADA